MTQDPNPELTACSGLGKVDQVSYNGDRHLLDLRGGGGKQTRGSRSFTMKSLIKDLNTFILQGNASDEVDKYWCTTSGEGGGPIALTGMLPLWRAAEPTPSTMFQFFALVIQVHLKSSARYEGTDLSLLVYNG